MFNRAITWLRSAPIVDEVDRRNAPIMQLLLLFYGVLLPANWVWRIASGELARSSMIVFSVDMLIALLALVSIALIRFGRFRLAILLFLAPQLISLALTFYMVGVMPQLIDPAPTMLTLAISGLVLGRRAMWIVWAMLMVVFAIGFATNVELAIGRGVPIAAALRNMPAVLISYTLITIILDRSINALRETLDESNRRGQRLQREMAERERAQSQLIHAQKLEATGRLASGVAHDFNNILDVILGFAKQRHRIRDQWNGVPQADALDESLERVEAAAARGTAITRKLLSFSRRELLNPENFDIHAELAELQSMIRQLFPSTVHVEVKDGAGPAMIHMDRSELELMLLNIAANARDAMPDGGRFTITTSPLAGEMVEIALEDTGHGIDTASLRHIFEPFFSTKSAVGGTGLGLSVIQDLIKATGGEIAVDSTVGQGTTFRIRLPLSTTEPAQASIR